ncbi:MAG TPA: metalloregulator ArsR/SmtB family transcription factor [Syntrophorhabdales bacterium]|nr:metalloregulator ArsR/SmtB family transcription factor [Syntrophorhabdales bacterium]
MDRIEVLSRLFNLLSEPNRLRILFIIGKEKKCVSDIIGETQLSQPLVSHHLRTLRESGVLVAERKAALVYYSLSDPRLIDLLQALSGIEVKGSRKQTGWTFPPMRFMQLWMKGGE